MLVKDKSLINLKTVNYQIVVNEKKAPQENDRGNLRLINIRDRPYMTSDGRGEGGFGQI